MKTIRVTRDGISTAAHKESAPDDSAVAAWVGENYRLHWESLSEYRKASFRLRYAESGDKPPRVVVEIQGGVCVGVYCSDPATDVTILDRDDYEAAKDSGQLEDGDAESLAALEKEIADNLTDCQ